MLVGSDPVLENVLKSSAAAGLPPIAVTPNLGKLLYLLARVQGAKNILEVGTLAGYSTIWLARALPKGAASSRWKPTHGTPKLRGTISPKRTLPTSSRSGLGVLLTRSPSLPRKAAGPLTSSLSDRHNMHNPDYFRPVAQALPQGQPARLR